MFTVGSVGLRRDCFALGALWLFAATIMRPWFAVLATASVPVLLPIVHFARDLYSEPVVLSGAGGWSYAEDPSCAIISANQASWADRGVNLIIGCEDQLALDPDVRVGASYELPEATLNTETRRALDRRVQHHGRCEFGSRKWVPDVMLTDPNGVPVLVSQGAPKARR
jgi:hypothetical protein